MRDTRPLVLRPMHLGELGSLWRTRSVCPRGNSDGLVRSVRNQDPNVHQSMHVGRLVRVLRARGLHARPDRYYGMWSLRKPKQNL